MKLSRLFLKFKPLLCVIGEDEGCCDPKLRVTDEQGQFILYIKTEDAGCLCKSSYYSRCFCTNCFNLSSQ